MSYNTPTEKCPYCGSTCEADWVDVGIGMTQCGPYYCLDCKASEIGLYDDIGFDRKLYHEWFTKNHKFEKQKNGKGKFIFIGKGEDSFELPKTSKITHEEWEKGWYKPNSPMGSSVNTSNGVYVNHKDAKILYDNGLLDEK